MEPDGMNGQQLAMYVIASVIDECRSSVDALRANNLIPLDMRIDLASDISSMRDRLAIACEMLEGQWD
ncbi:MAG: hypothetical protein OXG15_07355 [Gammaproteobacteria bacterium]|nr:hypothetical protein [Gammaproteobacteria bacterium]